MTQLLTVPVLDGIILRGELIAQGYTDRAIARLVQRGVLAKVRHGAYVAARDWREADAAARVQITTRAVLRQSRTELVVSHSSAMGEYGDVLWGLPTGTTHVTRTDQRSGRSEAGVTQHQGLLLPEDVVERNGVSCTSATRTAIDVTTVASTEASLVAVNHLLHRGFTTLPDIEARYASMSQHPHTLTTDLVLRLADPRIESVGESRTFFLLWRHGLPAPEPQLVITHADGSEAARLDFAWPERQRWLEFDGRTKYLERRRKGETVVDAVLREKQREDMIRELTGWRCLRITWADLADPVRLAARIRRFLGC